MKIAFVITSVLCSTILLSCSKGQSSLTVKDKLLGKWNIDSISSKEFIKDVSDNTPAQIGRPGDYMEFKSNGTLYSSLNNMTVAWSLVNDAAIKMGDSPLLEIKELTQTKLYLYNKRVISDTVYVEDKYFFHK